MVREFNYTSNKGTKQRKVLVIKETDSFIEGLDLSVLNPEVVEYITKTYKDYKPTTESVKIEGWDPVWNVAWRKFSKSKIMETT